MSYDSIKINKEEALIKNAKQSITSSMEIKNNTMRFDQFIKGLKVGDALR